jgi:hypothetical protein
VTEPRVRWGVGLIALGIALHVLYYILKAAEIGNIGAPSDIGGGLIPLAGYIAAAAGVVLLILRWLDRRSRNR